MFHIMLLLTLVGVVIGVGQPVHAEPLDAHRAFPVLCPLHPGGTGGLILPFLGILGCR